MSMLIVLSQETGTLLAAGPHVPMQDGIVDWVSAKNSSAQIMFRGLALTVAIIFVLYKAISSKLSLGTILVSGITAGVLVWLVFNVTEIEDRVGNEVDAAPTTSSTVTAPLFGTHSAWGTGGWS